MPVGLLCPPLPCPWPLCPCSGGNVFGSGTHSSPVRALIYGCAIAGPAVTSSVLRAPTAVSTPTLPSTRFICPPYRLSFQCARAATDSWHWPGVGRRPRVLRSKRSCQDREPQRCRLPALMRPWIGRRDDAQGLRGLRDSH